MTPLETLLLYVNEGRDPSALLHDSVCLHRLDGTVLHGKIAVIDAVCSRDTALQFEVLARKETQLDVALRIPGVPGVLRLAFRSHSNEGLLSEIFMEPAQSTADFC